MSSEKSSTRLSALEKKYIDLLERRVQDLERSLENGRAKKTKKAQESDDDSSSSSGSEIAPEDEPVLNRKVLNKKDKKEDGEKAAKTEPDEDKRYRVVINEFDHSVGAYVDRANDSSVVVAEPKASKRAFTLRKNRGPRRLTPLGVGGGGRRLIRVGSEIIIESLPLQKLLARVVSKLDAGKDKVTDMNAPFEDLIWSWSEAEAQAASAAELEAALAADFKQAGGSSISINSEQQARIDLRALLNLVQTSSGDDDLDAYMRDRSTMAENRTISFTAAWTLFPRGSLILARPFLGHSQLFVVQSCGLPDMNDSEPKLVVTAFSYDWNGSTFNRVPYQFTVDEFKDKKSISELPFYPLQYYRKGARSDGGGSGGSGGRSPGGFQDSTQDVEDLQAELVARGKTFFQYCTAKKGKQTFRYDGRVFQTTNSGLFRTGSTVNYSDTDTSSLTGTMDNETVSSSYVKGTVVVDFHSYFEYQPLTAQRLGSLDPFDGYTVCSCNECRQRFEQIHHYSWDKTRGDRPLSDAQYMLCPPRVLGYALDQKRWVHLDVHRLQPLQLADSKNFDEKLILHDDNKRLIKNSVQAHGKENVVDYTPGKGRGLILLLWGVPGVGKTLTAESVAMLAGKPLFSIGVSDIGTNSSMVESNLQRVFALAGLWEAVLLFDEADVFLEDRGSRGSDIHRNTMVSVLLRILEYYEGILILTTNRVTTFDIAVQSRIHIAIQYDELNQEQRERIFLDFLSQLQEKGHIGNFGEIQEWVHEEGRIKSFNGRQIRNTVYTAMGMAHADGRQLRRKDLVTVARNTETFKKVLADQEAVYRNSQMPKH